jgi:hypothetical protein
MSNVLPFTHSFRSLDRFDAADPLPCIRALHLQGVETLNFKEDITKEPITCSVYDLNCR